jgi:hypothetical protein
LYLEHLQTFLEEHSDWETKWNNDREKARLRALDVKPEGGRKSRFNNLSGAVEIDDGVGNPGSIRVQMRNTIKVEDHQAAGLASKVDSKDTGIDEWMGKPQKVALDIIDTQKFAEIVRQRHGAVKKEDVKSRDNVLEQSRSALTGAHKDKDFGGGGREVDKRRFDRVEMQIPARDNRDIRDRFRDSRALRGGGGRRRYYLHYLIILSLKLLTRHNDDALITILITYVRLLTGAGHGRVQGQDLENVIEGSMEEGGLDLEIGTSDETVILIGVIVIVWILIKRCQ